MRGLIAIAWGGAVALLIHGSLHVRITPMPSPASMPHIRSIEEMIVHEAWLRVPVDLAVNLAWEESHFLPKQVHRESRGPSSYGVMQLYKPSFPTADTMTPEENIRAGVRYLASIYKLCGKRPVGCAVRGYRTGRIN